MITIKYGLSYNGINYGWYEKCLYRLPCFINKRSYGFKKMKLIPIGNKFGYKISQKNFTIEQLKSITTIINPPYVHFEVNDKDLPWQK